MLKMIILMVLSSTGLLGVIYVLNNSKISSNNIADYKTFNDDRLLKNLKSEVSDKTIDDIINNINRSKNTLLEEALNSNKIKKTHKNN